MRKILWKHFLRNFMYAFVWVVFIMIFTFVVNCFVNQGEQSFLDAGPYAMIGGFSVVIVWNAQISMCRLSDEVFIMPISRKEREHMVKMLFLGYWVGNSVLFSIMFMTPTLVQMILNRTVAEGAGAECFAVVMTMIFLMYLFSYYNYFNAIESYHTITIMFVALVQIVIFEFVKEFLLIGGVGGFLGVCIVWLLLWLVNRWFHKHYFKEMVQFFASYESSRRLTEKKVSR